MLRGQQTAGNLRPGLLFAGVAALLGLSLGYGVAYVGRLVNIFFMDALFMGVLGGAILLLFGLALRMRPGKILVVGCVVLACSSWVGQRSGEYRFALRSFLRTAVAAAATNAAAAADTADAVDLENSSFGARAMDGEIRKRILGESRRLFRENLEEEVGHAGVLAFMEQQWGRGILLLRFGGWSHRVPLPTPAVVIGQILVTLGTFLLAWMIVRRLQWLPICSRCGRPNLQASRDAEQEENPEAICSFCISTG